MSNNVVFKAENLGIAFGGFAEVDGTGQTASAGL